MAEGDSRAVEKTLLKKLAERPMSVSQLASELGLRRDFVSGYLEALRAQGRLELVVVGRSHVYQPK